MPTIFQNSFAVGQQWICIEVIIKDPAILTRVAALMCEMFYDLTHVRQGFLCHSVYIKQQQPFYGPLSGTTRVSRAQKKHSPTHHPIIIRSLSASSIYHDP